jgi:ABC-type dipeptide/oligopeptide/nickel transport system permease component
MLIAVIVFFIISIIVFLIFNLDLDNNIGYIPLTPLPEEIVKELHLNESLITKYFRWMGNFFTGDWGESIMPASYYSE